MFKHRHLIVKRRENLTEAERDDLTRMLEYLPELATLRRFADRIYWLFDTPKDFHQASCRRAAIVRDPAFRAVPELVKAMEQLDAEKFPKLMAYLNNPVSRRVRTNNHVERTNRMFRFLEKVRYKWRRRRTLVRFVVLTLDGIWRERTAAAGEGDRSLKADRARQNRRAREETTSGRVKVRWCSSEECRFMPSELPRLFLARHGDTEWTDTRRHTGRTDVPLNERGEERTRQFGERLRRFSFASVFSSPLQRASRTCELAGFGEVATVDTGPGRVGLWSLRGDADQGHRRGATGLGTLP